MKVLRLHGARDLRLNEESLPPGRTDDVRIRIEAVGICGSDIHWYEEAGIGESRLTRPLVLGHEFAGTVAEGELAGRRVAVDPAIHCGHCPHCEMGNPNFCCDLRFAGHGDDDGALREFLFWPERMLHLLPEEFSAADGAMLEPLGVALHALDLGHLKPGMTVGVFGCGPIGLLLVQLARLGGATQIVATDLLQHRLEAAREMGATNCVLAGSGDELGELLSHTRLNGVDIAFEAAGQNSAVETSVASICPGGKAILVGIPPDDRTSFCSGLARRKGATIKMVRRMKHTYPRAIEMVQKGLVDVKSIVSHQFLLADFQKAFSVASSREGLKVVVETAN